MVYGNGAHIVHKQIEINLDNYTVQDINPYYTFFPIFISFLVSKKHASLIHTNPDHAIFSHRKETPLVISFQNYVLDKWMRTHSNLLQRLHYQSDLLLFTKMAVKRASAITAVSNFTKELVKKDLKIKEDIQIIYNSVDEKKFTPKKKIPYNRNEFRVFFSGNLTKRKGAHCLPAIAERLNKNVRLYYTQGLRTRLNLPQHDRLQSIGPVQFNDMPSRYNEMDILLMPTVREGFSLSVLEAMACGLPVVASDCSSLPEQVDEGRGGFLCNVGAVNEFAEKINHLAESPNLVKEMGQYNRSKVESSFTLKEMVNQYKKLFENVLAQKSILSTS